MQEVTSRSALIVKLGQIGDVIMAIPAMHALHQQGFKIDWVCGRAVAPLLACYSWIRTIPIDDKLLFFGPTAGKAKVLSSLWWQLARRQYDLCATLYYDDRYRLLTLPVRRRRTFQLQHADRAATLLPSRHPTDEFVRILLGLQDSCREQSMAPVRPDHLPTPRLQSPPHSKRVAIFAGGVQHLVREQITQQVPEQALRRWPVERFVALAERLLSSSHEIVLMGSPEDRWVLPHFAHLDTIDLIGSLTLPEVVSTCDACDVVVTHDTGPLHLAGLSRAGLVSIFGPTDPSTRVPRRPDAIGIWGGQGFACRPCYDGRDFAPCTFNGCMHQVTPDIVLREVERLLEARSVGVATPWKIVLPEGC